MTAAVLVTGGAGYIGSHTTVELVQEGFRVVVLDDFSNSHPGVIQRLRALCGDRVDFVKADVRDSAEVARVLLAHAVDSVVHFAGLKSVGDSFGQPLDYFSVNIGGTVSVLQAMERAGVRRMVFSSSATVYGVPDQVPVAESSALRTVNPYGQTKLVCEDLLRSLQGSDERWHVAILRYFNPVGAHESGLLGELPIGVPDNLMPHIAAVAAQERPILTVYGDDYPTPDGTGVRDFIHVMDLAKGHLAALRYLHREGKGITANLGTGHGVSVKELVEVFERVSGRSIPYRVAARRPGDVACCYADVRLAQEALGWKAALDVERMCADTWRWRIMNPHGFDLPAGTSV